MGLLDFILAMEISQILYPILLLSEELFKAVSIGSLVFSNGRNFHGNVFCVKNFFIL